MQGTEHKWGNPSWLRNSEQTSLEVENRGISGPEKGPISSKIVKENAFLRQRKMCSGKPTQSPYKDSINKSVAEYPTDEI